MTRVGGESHFDHRADEREFSDGHRLVDQYLTLQVAGHPDPLRVSTLVATRHGAQHGTTVRVATDVTTRQFAMITGHRHGGPRRLMNMVGVAAARDATEGR